MQVTYFPYLYMGQKAEINFGDVKVWNFDLKSSEYITDQTTRIRVAQLLDLNRSNRHPIRGIGVLSIGDIDFREFNEQDIATANEVRVTLFLASLSKSIELNRGYNSGHYIATSENFEYVFQNFLLDDDRISETAGYIVHRSSMGYRISEFEFSAPSISHFHLTFG